MTSQDLLNLFYEFGWVIKTEHQGNFLNYLNLMLKKNRVMVIWDDDKIKAILFYYITDDYRTLYKKSTWSIAKDQETGNQIYIDKMICKAWTVPLRRAVQQAIQDKFECVEEAYYHRGPKDRCVKIKRRDLIQSL